MRVLRCLGSGLTRVPGIVGFRVLVQGLGGFRA